MTEIRTIDMFSGAGGSSWGARLAGVKLVAALDMWGLAKSVYSDNFPDVKFHSSRIEELRSIDLPKAFGRIDLILASPECTNHGPAKGALERCEVSRGTAFQVTRFAEMLKPRWIVVENVPGMRSWARYQNLLSRLSKLGYAVSEQVVNSADMGVPQNRKRLFLLCDLMKSPPEISPLHATRKTAGDIVERNGTYAYTPLFTNQRAEATIERAERAIAELGKREPFLLVYYGSDQAGGWQTLDAPLRTLTTLDRFAFVKPTSHGHLMRMLQVPELKAAMGMPKRFKFEHGTRRDRVKLIGNAVCPPVMRSIVRQLTDPRFEDRRSDD